MLEFIKEWSWIVGLVGVLIPVILTFIDILTKTQLEKQISYRLKDNFIKIALLMVYISALLLVIGYSDLHDIWKKEGLYFLIIYFVLIVIITTFITVIVIWIFGWLIGSFVCKEKFKVDIKGDGKYWEIWKVTKSKQVILKHHNNYIILKSIDELNGKVIVCEMQKKSRFTRALSIIKREKKKLTDE